MVNEDLLDRETIKKLRVLRDYAETNPLPMEPFVKACDHFNPLDPRTRPEGVYIPLEYNTNFLFGTRFTYRLTFTIEHQKPGPCRHLSVSIDDVPPGVAPLPQVVIRIMEELGFQNPLSCCYVWPERYSSGRLAVNVLEVI